MPKVEAQARGQARSLGMDVKIVRVRMFGCKTASCTVYKVQRMTVLQVHSKFRTFTAELGVANSDAGQLQEDASTNYATTYTQINNGILKTEHIATDDGTASVSQESEMTGERGYADSRAGYFVEYDKNIGLVFALAAGSEAQLSKW